MSFLGLFGPTMDHPETVTFSRVAFCLVIAFGLGLAVSLLITPLVRWLAHRRGWLDRPDGIRKQHATPIPRIGGVAVYGAFFAAVAGAILCLPPGLHDGTAMAQSMAHLVVAATLVMLVGLLDDISGVRPLGKIAVQGLAGVYLFLNGYHVAIVTNPFGGEPIQLGWLALPVTVLWFVAMSNAFNLIDGLDGLAAGLGFFATATLLVSAVLNGRWSMAVVLCGLAGALLGFLKYNFNPASVFLGDSGSLFVGFTLAALAIRSSMKASAVVALGAPLCALALPILDVILATLRRLLTGHRVFEADQEHIHHRLLRRGLSPRRAVISLYGVAAVGGSLSLVTFGGDTQVIWGTACAAALLGWAGLRELGYAEFGEFGRVLVRRLFPERETVARTAMLLRLRQDLARAESLAATWDALVGAAEQLGFHRVEMRPPAGQTSSDWPPFDGGGEPKRAFPSWQCAPLAQGNGREWSWKVVLGEFDHPIAELTMTRSSRHERLHFEPSYLMSVIAEEFGSAWLRLREGSHVATRAEGRERAAGRAARAQSR